MNVGLSQTLLLGFIAGVTIVLGLPVARIRRPMPTVRLLLSASAVGILLFLLWDVLSAAWQPIDVALGKTHDHTGSLRPVLGYGVLFGAGLSVGLLSLVGYDRWMADRKPSAAASGSWQSVSTEARAQGGSAWPVANRMHEGRTDTALRSPASVLLRDGGVAGWSAARRLSLLIAVGIGLHNFAEGLAIGQAAAANDVAFATLLVVGFALHNATEGFGIVAPLAAAQGDLSESARPSWPFLAAMAAIGGGPTFLGTAIGHRYTSESLSVIFLTLAAGSIIYVVIALLGVAARAARPDVVACGVLMGMFAGFITDAVVTAAGL